APGAAVRAARPAARPGQHRTDRAPGARAQRPPGPDLEAGDGGPALRCQPAALAAQAAPRRAEERLTRSARGTGRGAGSACTDPAPRRSRAREAPRSAIRTRRVPRTRPAREPGPPARARGAPAP